MIGSGLTRGHFSLNICASLIKTIFKYLNVYGSKQKMKNENLIELKKIADLICEVRNKTDELLSDLKDDDSCFSDSDIEHDVLFILENAESAIDSILDELGE
jgi:hypothetical protein